MEAEKANSLSMRWVPVTDASGRTHMEAVWITETPGVAAPTMAPHAA